MRTHAHVCTHAQNASQNACTSKAHVTCTCMQARFIHECPCRRATPSSCNARTTWDASRYAECRAQRLAGCKQFPKERCTRIVRRVVQHVKWTALCDLTGTQTSVSWNATRTGRVWPGAAPQSKSCLNVLGKLCRCVQLIRTSTWWSLWWPVCLLPDLTMPWCAGDWAAGGWFSLHWHQPRGRVHIHLACYL